MDENIKFTLYVFIKGRMKKKTVFTLIKKQLMVKQIIHTHTLISSESMVVL